MKARVASLESERRRLEIELQVEMARPAQKSCPGEMPEQHVKEIIVMAMTEQVKAKNAAMAELRATMANQQRALAEEYEQGRHG